LYSKVCFHGEPLEKMKVTTPKRPEIGRNFES